MMADIITDKIGDKSVDMMLQYDDKDVELLKTLARIDAYKESVQRLPVPPKMAEYVNRLVVARAIHGTLAIEGSTLTEQQAQDVIASEQQSTVEPDRDREQKEVLAAKRAHLYVRENWGKDGSRPIVESDIFHIHRLLTETINYPNNIPGEYRHHPVQVGSLQHGGIYRPPEGHETIRQLMAQFVDWINSGPAKATSGPILAVLAHYFFVLIHPFGDGNGRVARVLESMILYQGGYNIKGFHSLANYYYRNRDAYFMLLQRTRTKYGGDQTYLLRFALQGLMEELQFIQDLIVARLKVVMFQDLLDESLGNKTLNGRQWTILQRLSEMPEGIPWNDYRSRTHPLTKGLYQKLTDKTLTRDLGRMAERRLIKFDKNGNGRISAIKAHIEIMNQYV